MVDTTQHSTNVRVLASTVPPIESSNLCAWCVMRWVFSFNTTTRETVTHAHSFTYHLHANHSLVRNGKRMYDYIVLCRAGKKQWSPRLQHNLNAPSPTEYSASEKSRKIHSTTMARLANWVSPISSSQTRGPGETRVEPFLNWTCSLFNASNAQVGLAIVLTNGDSKGRHIYTTVVN